MSFKTDLGRVAGLGSAKDGTHHWWSQRITSIALIPLTFLFIFPFARSLGAPYEEVVATYSSPFNALIAILFVFVSFMHMMQGLQTVIEDYVHGKAARTALLLANTLGCWALAFAGVFAIAKLAFTGA